MHPIQTCKVICQRKGESDGSHRACRCGSTSTTPGRQDDQRKQTERRNEKTQRSKQYRDQLTDVVTTLELIEAVNNNTEPNCPSPRYFYKTPKPDICQCTICYEDPTDHYYSIHVTRPKSNKKQTTSKRDIAILTRPKDMEVTTSTNKTSQSLAKTLQQRQKDYALARARIFNSAQTRTKTYKHPNHASRSFKIKI